MSEAKHTPGPWKAFNTFGQDIYPEYDSEAMLHIAELCPEGTENGDCSITYEEAKANAHLIAAAPEMLKALEQSTLTLVLLKNQVVTSCKKDPRWEGMDEEIQKYIDANRNAIALARGEDAGCPQSADTSCGEGGA